MLSATVPSVAGNVIVVVSVPLRVIVLLTVNVFPLATANVEPLAGAVIDILLILVAVATPNVGVVNDGLFNNANPLMLAPAGIVTVPVNVGSALGAFNPNEVDTDAAKLASPPNASANSFKVSNAVPAPFTKLLTAVDIAPVTNAVLAATVVLLPVVGVGTVTVPVNVGLVNIVDLLSLVTLPKPTSDEL